MSMRVRTADQRKVYAIKARHIRATGREAKTCINGKIIVTDGGVRCVRCKMVHRYGIETARELSEYINAPLCNPLTRTKKEAEPCATQLVDSCGG